MPTYAYQCTQCQHEFKVFQRMKDDPVSTCPECQGKVKRIMAPVGIVFKGSGWYVNDSRKPEKSEEPAAAKTSDAGSTEPVAPATSSATDGDKAAAKPAAPSST